MAAPHQETTGLSTMGPHQRSKSILEVIPNPVAVVEGLDQGQQGKYGSLGLLRAQEISLSSGICRIPRITSVKGYSD